MADRRRAPDDRRFVERDRPRAEAPRPDPRLRQPEVNDPSRARLDLRRPDEMDTRMGDTRLAPRGEYAPNRQDPRMDNRMDNRMDARIEPRMDIRQDDRMDMTDDYPYTAQRPPREWITSPPGGRPQYPERDRDRERERDDLPRNQIYEIETTPNENRTDYFLPGEGINRFVLQNEITKYLGSSAVSRPYTHNDGRKGFLITAYRMPTPAMISSIKESSAAYERDQRRREARGDHTVPYEEYMRQELRQQNLDRGPYNYAQGDIDMEDDRGVYRNAPGNTGYYADPRDYREVPPRTGPQVLGHPQPVTTAGYQPDPSYQAYTIGTTQPLGNQPRPFDVPRSMASPPVAQGGRTPPQAGPGGIPRGYESSGYPPTTQALRPPGVPTTYDYNYPERDQRADRHGPNRGR